MLIFYMLTGGKRIARENVFAEEYGKHFAKGQRYGLLRLLLSKMVAPLDRRYGDSEPVLRELRQIEQWELNAVGVLLDRDAIAATQQLQKRFAEEIERKENFETVRYGEIRLLRSVAESVVEWLTEVLEVQKNAIGAGGVLDVQVIRGRPGVSQPIKVDTGNNTLTETNTSSKQSTPRNKRKGQLKGLCLNRTYDLLPRSILQAMR